MTLRAKTLALVGLAIAALMAILYASSRTILLGSFVRLEEQTTEEHVQRALNALYHELDALDTTADDWAAWDDTYQFMLDRNTDYAASNLVDDTFVTLRLNAVLLVSPTGGVALGKAFDLRDGKEITVPQSLLAHLSVEGLLPPDGQTAGILLLEEGPMLAASRPILTSEDEGPARGWLIMGRYLDSAEVERLAEMTGLALSAEPIRDWSVSSSGQTVESSGAQQIPIEVRAVSSETIEGHVVVPDIYGAPALTLFVSAPRVIYQQGQKTVAYAMASLVLVGLAFGALKYVVIDRLVLRRVGRLGAAVARVQSLGDLSTTVPAEGKDELSTLGAQINRMLDALSHAQSDLRESEERFRRMADNIRDGLTIIEDGTVVYVNDRACEISGYPRDELVKLDTLGLAAPEERERLEPVLKGFELTDVAPDELGFWLLRKDGDRRFVTNHYASVTGDGGRPRCYVITTDITERKQAEDALRDQARKLEEMVEARTLELQEAQEELARKEKLALLGELAGGVSHELRNPLAVMLNAAYFLQITLPDADETTKEYLEMISTEVRAAAKIVSDLLTFSRTRSAERTESTVAAIVTEALRRKRPPRQVEVTTEIATDLPPVLVDPEQMGLVLSNLIANALEAMSDGGQLTISASADHDRVSVSVADTGHGISPENMERIFEPLFTTKAHGIGLGLTLCKTLVEANGGHISAQSEQGQGSTFTVVLPTS